VELVIGCLVCRLTQTCTVQAQIGQLMRAQSAEFVIGPAIVPMPGNPLTQRVNPGCERREKHATRAGIMCRSGHVFEPFSDCDRTVAALLANKIG